MLILILIEGAASCYNREVFNIFFEQVKIARMKFAGPLMNEK